MNRLVDLQYTYARMLIQYDLYGVLLGDTAADGREVIQAPPPAAVPEEGGAEEAPAEPPAETPADVPQEPAQSGEEG